MTPVLVNGDERSLADGTTVAELVASLTTDASGCAVAVNDEVLPKAQWSGRPVSAGDRVEILTAVQGG